MTTGDTVTTPSDPTETEPDQGIWRGAHRWTTVAICVMVVVTAFESLAITTVMPVVAADLNGLNLYALAFAAPLATGVIAMTVSGSWNDRSGPGAPLTAGTALFCAGLLLAGSTGSMPVLVVGLAVRGVGAGLISVSLYVLISRNYPPALRPGMFTALTAGWIVPALIGPAVAGVVAEHLHWRYLFLAVPVLAVAAAAVLLPPLRRPTIGSATTATHREPAAASDGVRTPAGKAWFAAGAAAGVLLLSVSATAADWIRVPAVLVAATVFVFTVPPLLPAGTWRFRRGLPSVVALRGLVGAAFTGAEVLLPLLLNTQRGVQPATAGLALTGAALTWFGGAALAGRRPPTRSAVPYVRIGGVSVLLGTAAAALPILSGVPVLVGIAGWTLAGLGMGLIYPTLAVVTLERSTARDQGANSSALQINDTLGSAVVVALGGLALAVLGSGPTGFLVGFGLSALLAAAVVVLAARMDPARQR